MFKNKKNTKSHSTFSPKVDLLLIIPFDAFFILQMFVQHNKMEFLPIVQCVV